MDIRYITKRLDSDLNFIQSTITDCLDYISKLDIVSVDIETTRKYDKYLNLEGLDPYTSDIVMLQVGDLNKQFIIDARDFDIKPIIKVIKDKIIVGTNLKFEYMHIYHHTGYRLNNLFDVMIVDQIIHNGYFLPSNLESMVKRYLNIDLPETIATSFLTVGTREFTKEEILYGANDIIYPLKIKEKQDALIRINEFERVVSLENLFVPVLGDLEYNGMFINQDLWIENAKRNYKTYKDLENQLNNFVIDNFFNSEFVDKQLDLFSDDFKCSVQWSSPTQVVKFFRHLGVCPKAKSKSTGKDSYTVNADVLKAHLPTILEDTPAEFIEFIKLYLKYKEIEKSSTTYGEDFLKHVHPITGRLHSSFRQILNTGRISSSNPNLQNLPADEIVRHCFTAPDGYKMIVADYSGQENIILANVSKDESLLGFYNAGETDMHSFNAKKIFDEVKDMTLAEIKEKRPDLRNKAKPVGFAIAYGGDGSTIAMNLGIPISEGEFIYKSYLEAYPTLNSYFERSKKESIERGYILIDEITNRKFFFSQIDEMHEAKRLRDWSTYYSLRGKYERASLNYRIQGPAGSITKYALILIRQYILNETEPGEVYLINTVHDEIVLYAKEDSNLERHAKALEDCMAKAGERWCTLVPLSADAVISNRWES